MVYPARVQLEELAAGLPALADDDHHHYTAHLVVVAGEPAGGKYAYPGETFFENRKVEQLLTDLVPPCAFETEEPIVFDQVHNWLTAIGRLETTSQSGHSFRV